MFELLQWEIRETGSDRALATVRACDPFEALNRFCELEQMGEYTFPTERIVRAVDAGESDAITPYVWDGYPRSSTGEILGGARMTVTLGAPA